MGISYGAHTPPDPFADPSRSHALVAHPRPKRSLAHEIRDAEARSVRERVPHERIGRRARRFVSDPSVPERTTGPHSRNLRGCPSATPSWRILSISARAGARRTPT